MCRREKIMGLRRKNGLYERVIKRLMDIVFSFIGMVLLSPVLLAVVFLVRIRLGSPVIFKQQRPGLNEKIFTLYKFRTMTDEKDESGKLLPDKDRLTRFGKWLRSTSLDELPELWNILKGDMSIVGPRPLLVEYLPLYDENQRRRHQVRPGLTGLAQINGRNAISWEKRFAFDVEYVDNNCLASDLGIILKTVKNVVNKKDITSDTSETMETFKG